MELDAEEILNNEHSGRVLRKRKKQASYTTDRVVKRRTNNIRITRSKRTLRNRSLDAPKKDKLVKDSHGLRSSTSTCSLKSVIYLGYYRKVPQLIILDDNNDFVQNQDNDQLQNQSVRCQNTTTPSSKHENNEQSSDPIPNNLWDETQDTNSLLNLLSEMCVCATYKRIVTRARTRNFKD